MSKATKALSRDELGGMADGEDLSPPPSDKVLVATPPTPDMFPSSPPPSLVLKEDSVLCTKLWSQKNRFDLPAYVKGRTPAVIPATKSIDLQNVENSALFELDSLC